MLDVLHVITGLERGGAELVLLRLAKASRARSRVVALRGGSLVERFRAAGIEVDVVDLQRGPAGPLRLGRALRRRRADVVQTWLYHGDLVGGLFARALGTAPVVWNLRNTTLGPGTRRSTRAVVRACATLSTLVPHRIVVSSDAAARVHRALGYDERRFVRIDNGVDVDRFSGQPDERAGVRSALRDSLGLPGDAFVVLCAARAHPQKDHATLLQAFARARAIVPRLRLILAGTGTQALLAQAPPELRRDVAALDARDDVDRLLWSADLAVSSSAWGESFPNAVVEALAAGLPVVATDVGDSGRIIGDGGSVVRPGDAGALAGALAHWAEQPASRRAAVGAGARARVAAEWGESRMAARYDALYEDVVDDVRRRSGGRGVRHRRDP